MTTLPAIPTPVYNDTAWITAVRNVSELAQASKPALLHGHIQRGTALVLHGRVWMEEDGRTCLVQATDQQTWWRVNGHCSCQAKYLCARGGVQAPMGKDALSAGR